MPRQMPKMGRSAASAQRVIVNSVTIACAVHLPQFRMPRLTVFRRIDIDAAGKQQAVQPLEDRAQRLFGQAERDDHGRRARCGQRGGVEAVHAVGRQIHVCGILIGRGRDADKRTRR